MDDEDLEILLLDALTQEPSSADFGFKINLESLAEEMCIEYFR